MSTTNHAGAPSFFQNDKLQEVREHNRFDGGLKEVQRELRNRRKNFLGSHLSLRSLVYTDGQFNSQAVEELSRYMSIRVAHFWRFSHPDIEDFCFRFFVLTITAITYKRIANECVDDILQFANCLVNSRLAFTFVMEKPLPGEMMSDVHEFVNAYPEDFYKPSFVDAVLGAVCVLLGVIADPVPTERSSENEEN